MNNPLALIFYKKLLPGSQLVNRLQDLGYRVQTVSDPSTLPALAEREKPLVLLADLSEGGADLLRSLTEVRSNPQTSHLPMLGFGTVRDPKKSAAAAEAGVTLVASDAAILAQLPQLLDQVLEVP